MVGGLWQLLLRLPKHPLFFAVTTLGYVVYKVCLEINHEEPTTAVSLAIKFDWPWCEDKRVRCVFLPPGREKHIAYPSYEIYADRLPYEAAFNFIATYSTEWGLPVNASAIEIRETIEESQKLKKEIINGLLCCNGQRFEEIMEKYFPKKKMEEYLPDEYVREFLFSLWFFGVVLKGQSLACLRLFLDKYRK